MNTKRYLTKTLLLAGFCMTALQVSADLVERPELAWKGNYDVKMISSQGMQAVWLSSTNPLRAIRPLTDEEMAYEYNDINNNVGVGLNGSSTYCGATPIIPTTPAGAVAISQIYADCDDDPTTFQSSAAYLDFGAEMGCTKVVAAYLYWAASSKSDGGQLAEHNNVGNTLRSMPSGDYQGLGGTAYRTVKFKAPGDATYTDVTASRYDLNPAGTGSGDRNICFADVTNLVKGKTGGLYWVANLRSGFAKGDGGATAGWSLIVIFQPPQCPHRTIKIWDGMQDISKGGSKSIDLQFASGEVPASGNSVSYLGIAVLDGENIARYLANSDDAPEFLEFQSKSATKTGTTYKINPFAPGQTSPFAGEPQPCYVSYDKKGIPQANSAGETCNYDGFSSSRISTYDPELGTNGNDVTRLPFQRNTLGYDAHHLRLPAGAMVADARSVTMKYYAGPQGGTSPFMAYMAIQTLQPEIVLTKRALASSVAPGATLRYRVSAANVGTLATDAGAVIVDTLDYTVEPSVAAENSAKFYNAAGEEISGNASGSVVSVNGFERRILTFTLPKSIAAGNGTIASDSIYVEFDVTIKDESHSEIWSLGCNRYTKNKADITYTSDGSTYKANSNATAGCDGVSVYLYTQVSSSDLDEAYKRTHIDSLTLGRDGSSMLIQSTILDSLDVLLTRNGVYSANNNSSLYKVYDSNNNVVSTSETFPTNEQIQVYTATAELENDCEETYTFVVEVSGNPSVFIEEDDQIGQSGVTVNGVTSAPSATDGSFTIDVDNSSAALAYYTVQVTDASGAPVYRASASGVGTVKFDVCGLGAGTYAVTIYNPEGEELIEKTAVVEDPAVLSVNLTSNAENDRMCKHLQLDVTADASFNPESGAAKDLNFAWEVTPDGESGTLMQAGSNNHQTQSSFEKSTTYTVYACVNDNKYQVKATKHITAVPTPTIEVIPSDSGCDAFYLPESYSAVYDAWVANQDYPDSIIGIFAAREVSGDPSLSASHIKMTYFDDKGRQITGGKTSDPGTVTAVMTVDETCSDRGNTQVSVLDFEDCFPIIVSKFFSPDANGQNDLLTINGIHDWHYESQDPHMTVFDRYGKKVYEADYEQIKQGWDGTYNGTGLPSGDYWYELTFNNLKAKVGHFTLKRRKE